MLTPRWLQMRLQSTFFGMLFLPPSIIAYGWVVHENVHIAAPVVFLFLWLVLCVSGV